MIGDFSRVALMLFARQEVVTEISDRQTIRGGARRPSGMKIIALIQILLQGRIGIRPWAKVMEFPPNLLSPPLGSMRE